jgi:TetR/AcrR family transcriptional regulator
MKFRARVDPRRFMPRLSDTKARPQRPGSRPSRLETREDRRARILEAARSIFAEFGFRGATTAEIAERAGIPKANLHYYYPTKEALYRAVTEEVLHAWLEAASSFDESDDPAEAIAAYIGAKMDMARADPVGSRIWASEILRGAPVIGDFLETTLKEWLKSREKIVKRWIEAGHLLPIEPRTFFYMIWATTQHYADFETQITALNGGKPLSNRQFAAAKDHVTSILLKGVLAPRPPSRGKDRRNP